MTARDEVRLLTALLEAEHATVYAYGVLGARLADPLRERARAADTAHRARRDEVRALLVARGAGTPGTAPAYDAVADTPEQALALAVRVEEGLGVRWRDLVLGTDDEGLRRLGASGLAETAVRAARWRAELVPGGAPTTAFPGVVAPPPPPD